MSVIQAELKFYGSASMPDDDSATAIGGAISTSKKMDFSDMSANGNVQVVSSASGDTTQTVAVSGRNAAGVLISETKTLSGTTVVPMTVNTVWERLLKAVKSGSTTGDVAVEAVTATRTGTAQAGTANDITLDSGASATDGYYNGQVIRLTSGTGSGQIRQIIDYNGTTKKAVVSSAWGTNPDSTSQFKVATGMVFDKSPAEILEVRRPFYNASAPASGSRSYYEKFFIKNTNSTLALTSAVVREQADPSGKITFMLPSSLDDTGTNGTGNNRQVAPSGTFDSSDKNVGNSQNLSSGSAQGVWMCLTLSAGDAATKTTWTPRIQGNTT